MERSRLTSTLPCTRSMISGIALKWTPVLRHCSMISRSRGPLTDGRATMISSIASRLTISVRRSVVPRTGMPCSVVPALSSSSSMIPTTR